MNKTLSLPLRSRRLLLRDFVAEDAADLFQVVSDPEVYRYLSREPCDEAGARDLISRFEENTREDPRKEWTLAAVRVTDGRVLGRGEVRLTARGAEVGYMLARDVWNQGYTTELARALIAACFDQLGTHRVYAECNAENTASWRVMEKCGMRREGHLRQDAWFKGSWHDTFVYSILKKEFLEGRTPLVP